VAWQEQIVLVADPEKMALYGIDYNSVYSSLSRATHERTLLTIRTGSSQIPVIVTGGEAEGRRTADLLALQVKGRDNVPVPLSYILQEHRSRDLASIVSGREGSYYPLGIDAPGRSIPGIVRTVERVVRGSGGFEVSCTGGWYESRALIRELALVLLVSLLLLFFILAAQFESLVQPLIILSEVAVDIFGALLALWLAGSSINLMSLIGIVVMAGIVINDSILKVDAINRLRREGMPLLRAILVGGERRLKPILMTSLTTIGAIAPFLIHGTMGADLQFPLSVALIGGMVVGTLVSLLFVPLFYYELYRRKDKHSSAR
ncbi:MAG: efflux RND transporter permease subunit, partial [Bacteroidales bacterium]|nr:efflux RND transporter permease subunit [Bacteroidales bacterium]